MTVIGREVIRGPGTCRAGNPTCPVPSVLLETRNRVAHQKRVRPARPRSPLARRAAMMNDDGVATQLRPRCNAISYSGLAWRAKLSLCNPEQGKVHTLPALQMYVHVGSGTGTLFHFSAQMGCSSAVTPFLPPACACSCMAATKLRLCMMWCTRAHPQNVAHLLQRDTLNWVGL